jgi:hypothetical protein
MQQVLSTLILVSTPAYQYKYNDISRNLSLFISPSCNNAKQSALSAESLVDEVDTEEVEEQAAEDIIRKCPGRESVGSRGGGKGKVPIPLVGNALKLRPILRVRLDPQAGREHELADRGTEAGKESIEGLILR